MIITYATRMPEFLSVNNPFLLCKLSFYPLFILEAYRQPLYLLLHH
ncbi:Uncharacterised protein [Klebsiella variicola]|nr:hypothetical protein [Klebsiella variicola]SLP37624.1 Uncharacterised protein [Klebsiella variicola]VAR78616.1 Uncharacterised protein [Klebsiella variicola]VAT60045.1 Uncharacterised protein [Klebsiella variicola]